MATVLLPVAQPNGLLYSRAGTILLNACTMVRWVAVTHRTRPGWKLTPARCSRLLLCSLTCVMARNLCTTHETNFQSPAPDGAISEIRVLRRRGEEASGQSKLFLMNLVMLRIFFSRSRLRWNASMLENTWFVLDAVRAGLETRSSEQCSLLRKFSYCANVCFSAPANCSTIWTQVVKR